MRSATSRARILARSAISLAVLLIAGPVARADCVVTIGMVMELTGPAGAFGRAAAKAVELALRDLNEAGGVHGCRLVSDTRDSQGQPMVAVDAANQLVQLKQVPVIIGTLISATTIPVLSAVTAPAGVIQVSPSASSPRLTQLARDGKTHGLFLRTVTSDALQGSVAAKFALEQGLRRVAVIYVNNDFGLGLYREFARAFKALGGEIVTETRYNERQSSYGSEVTAALAHAADALYLISTPIDGAAIARAWISLGGAQRFLLADGLNSEQFIRGVGAKYLEEAYGTSSGTSAGPATRYFNEAFPAFAQLDPASPAADRAYDAAAIVGLAAAAAAGPEPRQIRAAIARVTDPGGEVVHAGREEFSRALAILKSGRTVRYEGIIGPVSFDASGDITGPFRLWRITRGIVGTVGEVSADEVSALQTHLGT